MIHTVTLCKSLISTTGSYFYINLKIISRRDYNSKQCVTKAWLGLQKVSGIIYNWLDGSPLTFSLWASGQPSGPYNCSTQMYQGGNWRTDFTCTNKFFVICQLRLSSK